MRAANTARMQAEIELFVRGEAAGLSQQQMLTSHNFFKSIELDS
jgi:hypothetical protein